MPRKLSACADCQQPCRGLRCTVCAHAQPGGTKGFSRSVNSVGEFNAGHASGLAFSRTVNPTESEWLGKDRDAFRAWYLASVDRFAKGTGANHKPELMANWTF